jgi:hypothetical protein
MTKEVVRGLISTTAGRDPTSIQSFLILDRQIARALARGEQPAIVNWPLWVYLIPRHPLFTVCHRLSDKFPDISSDLTIRQAAPSPSQTIVRRTVACFQHRYQRQLIGWGPSSV